LRFNPVSTFTVTRAATPLRRAASTTSSNCATEDTPTCTSALTAGAKSVPGACSQASTGAVIPAARSSSASVTVATPSSAAPAANAARATSVAP
jgi:hypothetical protein